MSQKITTDKRLEVADQLLSRMREYDRTGDMVLRRQTAEELRELLPKSMWAKYGVATPKGE